MKSKKRLILGISMLAVVLTVAIIASVAIHSLSRQPPANDQLYFIDDQVIPSRIYTDGDGNEIALKYVHSCEQVDGGKIHYYIDSDLNEYSYNDANEFISLTPNMVKSEEKTQPTYTLTDSVSSPEDEMIRLAAEYARQAYGEEYFSRFQFDKIVYREDVSEYNIYFHVCYQDFIEGEICTIILSQDGSLVKTHVWSKGENEDFDPDMLNEISKSALSEFAQQQLQKEYADTLSEHEIRGFYLSKDESGQYRISIPISLTFKDETISPTTVTYYYGLK